MSEKEKMKRWRSGVRPRSELQVEIWSLDKPAPRPLRDGRTLSRVGYLRRVVGLMWTSSDQFTFNEQRRVPVLTSNNKVKHWEQIGAATAEDQPLIVRDLRPDLFSVDFDDVPTSIVEEFIEENLADRVVPYLLIRSSSARRMIAGERCVSFHLHVITSSPGENGQLDAAVKRTNRRLPIACDESEEASSVRRMNASRPPLGAHRWARVTSRLRAYGADNPWVYKTILEVFEAPCVWSAGELAEFAKRERDAGAASDGAGAMGDLTRIASRYRKLLSGELKGSYTEYGRALAIVNHLEARGWTSNQIWNIRNEPGLVGYARNQYEKPISDAQARKRLVADFESAKRTREQHRGALGRSPIGILAAALQCFAGATLKIAAACVDAISRDGVRVGQARLGEIAGVPSPKTVVNALRSMEENGWLVRKEPGLFGRRGARFEIEVPPALMQPKGKDNGFHKPPVGKTRVRRILHELRELLRSHAFRVRGLRPPILQIILADRCGIDRRHLPIGERTMSRALEEMRQERLLDGGDRLVKDYLDRVRHIAKERGLVEEAKRQRDRNEAHRVEQLAKTIAQSESPTSELRMLEREHPDRGAKVRKRVEQIWRINSPTRLKPRRRIRRIEGDASLRRDPQRSRRDQSE